MTFEEILEHITALLTFNVIKVSDQQITLGDILFIPLLVIAGLLLSKWLIKLISKRLRKKKTDPNVIHLVERILFVIAIAVIIISILDFMNVPIAAFAFLSGAIAIGFGFGAQNTVCAEHINQVTNIRQKIRFSPHLDCLSPACSPDNQYKYRS